MHRLRENPETYGCPTGCAYKKENDDSVWCFKPGTYKYSDKCYPGKTHILMSTSTSGEFLGFYDTFLQRSIHVTELESVAKTYQELVNSLFMPEPISQTLMEEGVLVIIGVSLLSTTSFPVQLCMFAKETR